MIISHAKIVVSAPFPPLTGGMPTLASSLADNLEHDGNTVLKDILSYQVNNLLVNQITPKIITTGEFGDGCIEVGEALEGMLVQINNIQINGIDSWGSWYVDDGSGECEINNYIFEK